MKFTLLQSCPRSKARLGLLELPRAVVQTPVFMPVGTNATVKAMRTEDLRALGFALILANTYHLYLRPGEDVISGAGGLRDFMRWDANILTDSGGFQVFSLSSFCKISDAGAEFRSHIDGSKHFFTPEKVIDIQTALASDIMMPLDECTRGGATYAEADQAEERTYRWAKQSLAHWRERCNPDIQTLFGIVQGNVYPELRRKSCERLTALDFPGYAVGGLSVGESKEQLLEILELSADMLPREAPRYLMGVGEPLDILRGVERGIDMFDCVLPTRNARNASLFTRDGSISLRNARHIRDYSPVDAECRCPVCRSYSRAYLHHLYKSKEILASMLGTLHNLAFLADLLGEVRGALTEGRFVSFAKDFSARYTGQK